MTEESVEKGSPQRPAIYDRFLRDPKAAVWLWATWLGFSLVLGLIYANRPPSPDLATFDYISWIVRSGGTLYVDVFEQNWPGAVWLHTISTTLFGNHLWSYRAFDFLIMSGAALCLSALLRRAGAPLAAVIVVPLHQLLYTTSNLWFAGQRDVVAAHILLVATWAYLFRTGRGGRLWVVPLGIATALAMLIRPTYLLFPALLFVSDLCFGRGDRSPRDIVLDMVGVVAAFLISIGTIAAVAHQSGALEGWWAAAVLFNTQMYSQDAASGQTVRVVYDLLQSWHWYMAFAGLGFIVWWARGERQVFGLISCFFVLGFVSVLAQGKALGYHLGAWIIVFSAFSATFTEWAVFQAARRRTILSVACAVAVCGIVAGGSVKKVWSGLRPQVDYVFGISDDRTMHERTGVGVGGMTAQDVIDAARFSRERSAPDETVLVWDRAIVINFLAERALPTPFATVGILEIARPPFVHAESWVSSFERTLELRPPSIVFAPGEGRGDRHSRLFSDPDSSRAALALRRALAERYAKGPSFGSMDAYLLVADSEEAS